MIQLRVHGNGFDSRVPCPTVRGAKQAASAAGWLTDSQVRAYEVFVAVEDFHRREVHEWSADWHRWETCEMAEEAQP